MRDRRPEIVLVHGGFMGGWCWRRVADRLADRGARVFTPTLTGLGERSHLLTPEVGLATHVADIENLVRCEGLDQFVLCGHSYGGVVISAVAERMAPRIRSLVYLDAQNPPPGTRVWDALSDRARQTFTRATNRDYAIPPGCSSDTVVNKADAPWVDSLATPQPRRTLEDRTPATNLRETIATKLFVRAHGYRSGLLDASAEHAARSPGWDRIDLPFAHNLMIDEPELTTAILADLLWPGTSALPIQKPIGGGVSATSAPSSCLQHLQADP